VPYSTAHRACGGRNIGLVRAKYSWYLAVTGSPVQMTGGSVSIPGRGREPEVKQSNCDADHSDM